MPGGWWSGHYNPDYVEQTETLFALSNGFLGIRASFEEGRAGVPPGTLLNGFHETWPIVYPERRTASRRLARRSCRSRMGRPSACSSTRTRSRCETTEIRSFDRSLDMRVARSTVPSSTSWPTVAACSCDTEVRLAGPAAHGLHPVRGDGAGWPRPPGRSPRSSPPAPRGQRCAAHDPRRSRALDGGGALARGRARRRQPCHPHLPDGRERAGGGGRRCDHDVRRVEHDPRPHPASTATGPRRVRGRAPAGQPLVLTKWLAYHYGQEAPDRAGRARRAHVRRARATGYAAALRRARARGGGVLGAQRGGRRWPVAAQQALHFVLFTLLQASLRSEGSRGAGQGPDRDRLRRPLLLGHRDLRPAVPDPHVAGGRPQPAHAPGAACCPTPARRARRGRLRRRALPVAHDQRPRGVRLLRRRHRAVPHRRRHRLRAGPVRAGRPATTSCCSDTAWSCSSRPRGCGPSSASSANAKGGDFVINKVTGPDEYTTVVDNNLFTNLMAPENLRLAADAVERVPGRGTGRATGAGRAHRAHRRRGRRSGSRPPTAMYIPYDERRRRSPPGRRLPRSGDLGLRRRRHRSAIPCSSTTTRW